MNNEGLIKAIIDEADELHGFATGGGANEYAFDLTADTKDLEKILEQLTDFGTRIRLEVNN